MWFHERLFVPMDRASAGRRWPPDATGNTGTRGSTMRRDLTLLALSSPLALGAAPALAAVDHAETTTRDEIRAVVADMLADAQTRSSLLRSSGTAGHDGSHFFVADASGDFELNISGSIQYRYVATFRDDDDPAGGDVETGFDLRRLKMRFHGHAFSPNLRFKIQSDLQSGDLTLEDAYFGYHFEDSIWAVYAGQVRLPLLWEDVNSDNNGLAVSKSVVNTVFNPGRSKAAWLQFTDESFRGWLAFSDGAGSANTGYSAPNADFALTSRLEWMFSGTDWSEFNLMSSFPGTEYHGKIGGAVHYQDGPNQSGFDDNELLTYGLDAQVKGDGWNVYAGFVGRHLKINEDAGPEYDDYGFLVQGGFFIPETDWELFARYDMVLPDSDYANDSEFSTVTAGANWFIYGNAARFTFDVQWHLDATEDNDLVNAIAVNAPDSINILPSGEENQFSLRAQVQLLF